MTSAPPSRQTLSAVRKLGIALGVIALLDQRQAIQNGTSPSADEVMACSRAMASASASHWRARCVSPRKTNA